MENKESLQELADRVKKTQEYIDNIKGTDMNDFVKVMGSLPDIQGALKNSIAHLSKGEQKKMKPLMDQLSKLINKPNIF